MKILVLSDCLISYHSFWIRIGQYLEKIKELMQAEITVTDDINEVGKLRCGDRLIIYRHSEKWGNINNVLKKLRKKGIIIFSDVDDYLWHDGNRRGWTKRRLFWYSAALKQAHIITCSTENLRSILSIMFKNQACQLIPNTAPRVKTKKKVNNNLIRIGWTGAPWTRPSDLKIIKPLAKWLIKTQPKVRLVHVGHVKELLSFAEALDIDENTVEKRDLNGHAEYLTNLDFDIGLAPLMNNCFNSFKSSIKIIEYSAAKIPWLASKNEAYKSTSELWGTNDYLCETEQDWIEKINPLLEKSKREEQGQYVYNICEQTLSFNIGVESWIKILKREQKSKIKRRKNS